MLYLIGMGLGSEKDITINGLEAVKSCDKVFLECYTSKLVDVDVKKLEEFYGKKIILADRDLVENNPGEILNSAKKGNAALLIVGSPLGATTHMDILQRAKKLNIDVNVIDNAGILTAVGITGLSLYKFGRVVTIPKDNKNVISPYDFMLKNKEIGLHTLVLLDINEELMSAREGLDYLIRCGMDIKEKVIVCGGLGGENPEIKYGEAGDVSVSKFPQCVILLGELHFAEEEFLNNYL
ncbi:MAG: diphthine synthase [Nanoarchaeota archaeon]|nr:diphthine synthase [Nanoarchaeota archaeon]